MPEIETISWTELTGNKFNKNLESAMLTEDGYIKQQRIRRTGEGTKSIFYVKYDRDYLVEYLSRVVCKNLFTLGREQILSLVAEAWDTCYGNTPIQKTTK